MSWNPQAGVVKDSTQRQNPSDSLAKALQASAPVAMLSPVRTDNSSLSSCQVWQSCADRTTNRSRQACACELLIHIVNHNYILVSFPTTKEGLQRHALDLDKWQEAYWDRGDDQMHYSRAGPIMMYWGSAVMSRSTVVKSCLRNLEGHRRKKKAIIDNHTYEHNSICAQISIPVHRGRHVQRMWTNLNISAT